MGKKTLAIVILLGAAIWWVMFYFPDPANVTINDQSVVQIPKNTTQKETPKSEEPVVDSRTGSTVCFEDTCFNVEIADTREERAQGLMHRESLAEKEGMLFIFEEVGPHSFWMKNTLIGLDMIWMDEEGTIVSIHEYAIPCEEQPCTSYKPDTDAKYVLEVMAGTNEYVGLEKGDEGEISIVE